MKKQKNKKNQFSSSSTAAWAAASRAMGKRYGEQLT
jgi:hypothetical protein